MTPTSRGADRMEALYAFALRLYPPPFREAYAAAMRQALRDAMHDRERPHWALIPLVLRDLITSLAKEHLAMMRDTFSRPALLFNALVLAALATGLGLALAVIPQQVLRQGADDPQIQLAGDLVARLEQGVAPSEAVPAGSVDMARSLSPFVIAYDDQGHPLASQAQLNGTTPAPPSGVFDYVRQHGEERVSWQPVLGNVHGVRIAAVVQRVGGPHPGFVLAGRNMRELEVREDHVRNLAALTWIGMLVVILFGTIAFGWYSRPKTV
jgi:hypothetical protein